MKASAPGTPVCDSLPAVSVVGSVMLSSWPLSSSSRSRGRPVSLLSCTTQRGSKCGDVRVGTCVNVFVCASDLSLCLCKVPGSVKCVYCHKNRASDVLV